MCSVGIIVVNDAVTKGPSVHSHPPDCGKNPVIRTKNAIRLQSSESSEATSSIIQKCTKDFPLAAAAASLPKSGRSVRRQRFSPEGNSVAEDIRFTTR